MLKYWVRSVLLSTASLLMCLMVAILLFVVLVFSGLAIFLYGLSGQFRVRDFDRSLEFISKFVPEKGGKNGSSSP